MRYSSHKDSVILQRSALGPAAIAARAQAAKITNLGLKQKRFVSPATMARGGSFGALGAHHRGSLSCLCGPGDPGFGALAVPSVVRAGPIAVRMIKLRRAGYTDKAAYYDAILTLHAQGENVVTPEIHLQLAAGLQPLQSGLSGFLGSLGLAPVASTGLTAGSVAGSSVGVGAATAVGLGSGVALGQTVIPIPVVGAIIGAVAFEAYQLTRRKVGKAEASWKSSAFQNSLNTTPGSAYTDQSFSEAFKGMMDTNGNLFTCCGPDRHKNPDQFLGPLAGVVAQGYLNQTVPLTATTSQVFQNVVVPWIKSGAGGLMTNSGTVNWLLTSSASQVGRLMIQGAVDKYLAGQALTRGDMPAYGNQGAHTPTLVQALAPMLQQPTTSTPSVAGAAPAVPPSSLPPQTPLVIVPPNSGPPSVVATSPALPVPGSGYYPPPASGPAVGYSTPMPTLPTVTPGMPAPVAAGFGAGLPSWALLAIAAVGVGFLFFKAEPVKTPPNV
jgi:hypothetical protein